MNPYPKRILTIPQQLQSYTDAGMTISSVEEATVALTTIGYYRLRGYSFHLYDNLSKTIKNMKTGKDSAYPVLAGYYRYRSPRGKLVKPSLQMLSSWIQSVSVLRNMCAHNSRIYNRTINTFPKLLIVDQLDPRPLHNGLYQILLTMKSPFQLVKR